jgi:PBP1b-binding outer membrane lipoprotein LpoB
MKRYIIAALAILSVLFSSCVKDETYPYASISQVSATTPVGPEAVTVTATINSLVETTVNLIYSVNSADSSVSLSPTLM